MVNPLRMLLLSGLLLASALAEAKVYTLIFDTNNQTELLAELGGRPLVELAGCCEIRSGTFAVDRINKVAYFVHSGSGGDRLLGLRLSDGRTMHDLAVPAAIDILMLRGDNVSGVLYALARNASLGPRLYLYRITPGLNAFVSVGSGIRDCCSVVVGAGDIHGPNRRFHFVGGYQGPDAGTDPALRLFTLDLSSGNLVSDPQLPSGIGISSLTVDPSNQTLYAWTHTYSTGASALATVNAANAAVSPLAAVMDPGCCAAGAGLLAADSSRSVAVDYLDGTPNGDRIVEVTLATGALNREIAVGADEVLHGILSVPAASIGPGSKGVDPAGDPAQ